MKDYRYKCLQKKNNEKNNEKNNRFLQNKLKITSFVFYFKYHLFYLKLKL